jgi:LuxR family maltose regulon positive regulatory protein
MAEAYAHLAAGRDGPAAHALVALIRFAEPRGLQRTVLRASLLLVAVLDSRGDPRGADDMFEQALVLGAGNGMSRVFAEMGGPAVQSRVAARVASLRDAAPTDPGRLRLIRQWARWQDAVPKTVVRLTARESDVLGALDQGGADKMVGRRLGITDHAVRYHLKNIYRKLGVNDRVGALSQAREAGLLG